MATFTLRPFVGDPTQKHSNGHMRYPAHLWVKINEGELKS